MIDLKGTHLYTKIKSLSAVSERDLKKLSATLTFREIKKGSILLKEKQICRSVFFIENGYLRTFALKDDLEINLAFNFETSFVTNLKSLRSETLSEITIQAGEDSVIYEFDKDTLLALYTESKEIESFGRKISEELLIHLEEHANLFKLLSPAERYIYLRTHHPEIIQRVSLSHIASYLGVARETLSRIRKLK